MWRIKDIVEALTNCSCYATYVTWFNRVFFVSVHVGVLLLLLYITFKTLDHLIFARHKKGEGRSAFVSGCDSGFGYGAAYQLNDRGVHVFAACLTHDAVQRFIEDDNFKGTAFIMNITNRQQIETTTKMIEDKVKDKGLDIMINNAGIGDLGPIEWMSEEDLRKISDVNLWGHVNTTKAMLHLIKRARGRVVNVSSMMGRITLAYMSGYCMSKHAFEAFSDALRMEMKSWGVSVHIVEPGLFRTNVYRDLGPFKRLYNKQPDLIKQEYKQFYEDWMKRNDPSNVDRHAGDPRRVVDAYVHASLSTRPRERYLVGIDAHFLSFTVGMLPTRVGDSILRLFGHGGL